MSEKTPPYTFRKKPVEIQAVQYHGMGNIHPRYKGRVPEWMWEALESTRLVASNGSDPLMVLLDTGDWAELPPGWWLIHGTKGELYPCDPEVFDEIYEAVEA